MQLGGLELPRTKVHYVLSVTRLPFRHSCCSTSWIRTSADNRQRIYNPTPLATQSSCYSVLDYVRASVPAHALSLIFERSLLALIVPVGFAQKLEARLFFSAAVPTLRVWQRANWHY